MIPVIALVGRPNVGKSTLFNQLTKTRDALVADYSGLTRDRKYGEGKLGEQRFMVIDTGGITGEEQGIDAAMAAQSLAAIDEADVVLLMVDGRAGLQVGDQTLVRCCANATNRLNSSSIKSTVSAKTSPQVIFIAWVSVRCIR